MAIQEIPQGQWKTFFDDLSREYESGLVTVEVRGGSPPQPALSEMPLLGISLEDKGSGRGRLDIMVGNDVDSNTSHTISHPAQVRAETDNKGNVTTLTINAEDGEPVTVIRFLSAT